MSLEIQENKATQKQNITQESGITQEGPNGQETLEQMEALYNEARDLYYHTVTAEKLNRAKEIFEKLGDYQKSQEFLEKCRKLIDYSVGNTVTFGCYDGKPIRWKVLEENGRMRLLFAENIVAYKPYNVERNNMVWQICSLRKWLNRDFLNDAFTLAERMNILITTRQNPANSEYSTQSGPETRDKVFVFSFEELEHYLPTFEERALDEWWWLRTQGHCLLSAECVQPDGDVYHIGLNIADGEIGVRPAIWVMMRR